jgi:hypothetical protein
MNQAVVHSLAMLYNRTGEQKFLDLAQEVVADFSTPGAGDYLQAGLNEVEFFKTPKPRWESLHPIMGLAELYWITGDKQYRTAFENLWWSIVKTDRHNNGGFSSGEQAQGNPYHQGAIETCCTIAWMAMSVEMLRLTGNPIVADELELSTYNQAIGGFSPTGRWSTYNTPMLGRRIPSTQDIAFQIRPGSEELNCCSVNAARGLGLLSEWALMCDRDGLVLNWYGPATLETNFEGTPIVLQQSGDYPRDGVVQLAVNPEKPAEFELKLRIPHWSRSTKVFVNETQQTAEPGTYLRLKRLWKKGDQVVVHLDMSPRYWVGERESAGKSSIYRGPILLVAEGPQSTPPKFEGAWNAYGPARSALAKGAKVAYEFVGDQVEWRGALFDDAGKARVLIDSKEQDVVDQYGPQRGTPFVWKKTNLGPGPHTLVIEVLGEKSDESSGTWINISKVVVPIEWPKLSVDSVASGKVLDGGATALIRYAINDATQAVELRDFATAGFDASYNSWLDVEGVTASEFSKQNPSRTVLPK